MHKFLERTVLFVSLAAGLTAAVLYVLGGVAISAQLHEAGVNALDGIGWFSLSQILTRGIAVAASPSTVFITLVLGGAAIYFFRKPLLPTPGESPSRGLRAYRWAMIAAYVAIIGFFVYIAPEQKRLAYLVLLAIPIFMAWKIRVEVG